MQDRITLRRNPQNVAVQQGSVDLYIDSSGNLVKEAPGEVRTVVGGDAVTIAGDAVAGASTGGNGTVDSGKVVLFNSEGALYAAAYEVSAPEEYADLALGISTNLIVLLDNISLNNVSFNVPNNSITANRSYTLPDVNGTVPIVPVYADLDAANTALAAGEFFWDTTLKKLRTTTA